MAKDKLPFYVFRHNEKSIDDEISDLDKRVEKLEKGGGGGGSQPGPNTVGTDEIINGSVEMVDLSKNVKDKMLTDSDRVTQEELENFEV